MMKTIVLALVAVVGLHAQVPPEQLTNGDINCRGWLRTFSRDMRLGFVIGFNAATLLTKDTGLTGFYSDANSGEEVKGVDALCAVPENGHLPAYAVLFAFVLKTKGASEEQINTYLEQARKSYSLVGKEGRSQ